MPVEKGRRKPVVFAWKRNGSSGDQSFDVPLADSMPRLRRLASLSPGQPAPPRFRNPESKMQGLVWRGWVLDKMRGIHARFGWANARGHDEWVKETVARHEETTADVRGATQAQPDGEIFIAH